MRELAVVLFLVLVLLVKIVKPSEATKTVPVFVSPGCIKMSRLLIT